MWKITVINMYPKATLVFPKYQEACDIAKAIIMHSVEEVRVEISYQAAGEEL